uniref:recombinase family protein n=1 Tax=Nocardia sp. C-14-1 TaxID=312532 RepID=UPI001867222B|nr:recombinase family protein [Nocardia sp. C-14-1]
MNANITAALAKASQSTRGKGDAPAGTAVAYLRVSTDEQAKSGAGVEVQRRDIEAAAAREGWTITAWYSDEGVSGGKGPAERPGLAAALADITEGRAERMIVQKVDRLSRKFKDAVMLMEAAITEGWPIYVVAQSASTETQHGRFLLRLFANLAEDERDTIRQRTRDALAAKKAAGVRLGRPQGLPDDVVLRIITERNTGTGYQRIANGLNDDAVPTAQGGAKWYPATVRAVLNSKAAEAVHARVMHGQGMTVDEISEALDCSVKTVYRYLADETRAPQA